MENLGQKNSRQQIPIEFQQNVDREFFYSHFYHCLTVHTLRKREKEREQPSQCRQIQCEKCYI